MPTTVQRRRYEVGGPAADIARARELRHSLPTNVAPASCLHLFTSGMLCALEAGHGPDVPHVSIRKDRTRDMWVIDQVDPAELTPAADMDRRLTPTARQIERARALLDAEDALDAVIVGVALPGKQRGVWTVGQPVEPAPGLFPADDAPCGLARSRAEADAEATLAGRDGCTGYVRIDRVAWAAFVD